MTDGELREQYCAIYVESAAERVAAMDGLVRDLAGAWDPGAIETLYRCAHSMKSLAAMVAYGEASAVSARLEQTLRAVHEGRSPATPTLLAELRQGVAYLRTHVAEVGRARSMPAANRGLELGSEARAQG